VETDSECGTTPPIRKRHDLRVLEKGGKLTVSNPSKPGPEWSYETFSTAVRPVAGQKNPETAVEIINDKSIRIYKSGTAWYTRISTRCRTTTTR
jgi:hypothetical protein